MYLEITISKKKNQEFQFPTQDVVNDIWRSYNSKNPLFKGIEKDVFTNSMKSLQKFEELFLKHIAHNTLLKASEQVRINIFPTSYRLLIPFRILILDLFCGPTTNNGMKN